MIDLCKIFGVEEGEEFKLEWKNKEKYINDIKYKIEDNYLLWFDNVLFRESGIDINEINDIINVIVLPKKKQFTDDELCILRNIDKKYKWVGRDKYNSIYIFADKPIKKASTERWASKYYCEDFKVYNHLFQNIQWEDEEPVFIDDYVERGAE